MFALSVHLSSSFEWTGHLIDFLFAFLHPVPNFSDKILQAAEIPRPRSRKKHHKFSSLLNNSLISCEYCQQEKAQHAIRCLIKKPFILLTASAFKMTFGCLGLNANSFFFGGHKWFMPCLFISHCFLHSYVLHADQLLHFILWKILFMWHCAMHRK